MKGLLLRASASLSACTWWVIFLLIISAFLTTYSRQHDNRHSVYFFITNYSQGWHYHHETTRERKHIDVIWTSYCHQEIARKTTNMEKQKQNFFNRVLLILISNIISTVSLLRRKKKQNKCSLPNLYISRKKRFCSALLITKWKDSNIPNSLQITRNLDTEKYIYVHVYIYVCVYVYMSMRVCVYIYI